MSEKTCPSKQDGPLVQADMLDSLGSLALTALQRSPSQDLSVDSNLTHSGTGPSPWGRPGSAGRRQNLVIVREEAGDRFAAVDAPDGLGHQWRDREDRH